MYNWEKEIRRPFRNYWTLPLNLHWSTKIQKCINPPIRVNINGGKVINGVEAQEHIMEGSGVWHLLFLWFKNEHSEETYWATAKSPIAALSTIWKNYTFSKVAHLHSTNFHSFFCSSFNEIICYHWHAQLSNIFLKHISNIENASLLSLLATIKYNIENAFIRHMKMFYTHIQQAKWVCNCTTANHLSLNNEICIYCC